MTKPSSPHSVRLCLVCDDAPVIAAVRVACRPPHEVTLFSMHDLVDERHTLSAHGRAILETAASQDAILVGWALDKAPLINTLCYHARRSARVPVIALCSGAPDEPVAALAAGADDVVTFPLYLPLVHMKAAAYRRLVEAVRQTPAGRPADDHPATERDVLRLGPLRLDRRAHRVTVHDREVPLTPREFSLLDFLLERTGAACSRDEILDHVWGITFDTGTNMVDVYMYFLRKKLAAHGLHDVIQTVRGHGYRLTPDATETP